MAKKNQYKLVGEIPYVQKDNGDGSSSAILVKDNEAGEKFQEREIEENGYAVDGDGNIKIFEKDGKLYYFGITGEVNDDGDNEYDYFPLKK